MIRPSELPRAAWPALVAVVAVVVYLNSVPNGFALDDVPLVRDNPDLATPGDLPRFFSSPYWPAGGEVTGLYRPVTVTSLAWNRALLGEKPAGFHVVNVLLHALVSVLVWFVARAVSVHYGTALAAALLFAVHPLHTEAVANITGRAELLGALFVLAAWRLHRRGAEAPVAAARVGWLSAAGASYLLAVLSKENALLAPVLFALDDRLAERRGTGRAAPLGLVAAAYGAALAIAAALRIGALGGLRGAEDKIFLDNPGAFAGPAVRVATALWIQVRYAWLTLWPARLSSDYSYDAIPVVGSVTDPRLLLGVVFAAALGLLVVVGCHRSRPVAVGAAAWIVFFLPASNLFFPIGTTMAERLAYLPSVGALLLAGHAAAGLGARIPAGRRPALGVALCAVGLVLAGRTVARNPVWRDNATLALQDVTALPRSAKLQAGAGIAHFDRGETGEAERAFRRAIDIYPDYAQVRFNLGQLLVRRGAPEEAIEHLARAAALAPGNPRPCASLHDLPGPLETRGRAEAALAAYAAIEQRCRGDLAGRFNHGRLLLALGRTDDAVATLSRLGEDDRAGLFGALSRALAAHAAGRHDEATALFREVLSRRDLPPDVRQRVTSLLGGGGAPPARP